MLRVTAIRVRYRARIPRGSREKADRALERYAERCPAYNSVKECIEVSSTADWTEE